MEFYWENGSSIGLIGDIRNILDIYRADPDLGSLVPTFELMDHAFPKKYLKSKMVAAFNRTDFEIARVAVIQSALVSTGQADGMRRISHTMRGHCKVLPQLVNPLFTAPERTIYFQVLVGCDFITPFSYRNKPKCCLCGARKVTTKHLVTACPKTALCAGNSGILLVDRILTQTECPPDIQEILERQVRSPVKNELFWTLMGVFDFHIYKIHKKYINSLLKITANRLLQLKMVWIDKNTSHS